MSSNLNVLVAVQVLQQRCFILINLMSFILFFQVACTSYSQTKHFEILWLNHHTNWMVLSHTSTTQETERKS
jgi:hypothetical protein